MVLVVAVVGRIEQCSGSGRAQPHCYDCEVDDPGGGIGVGTGSGVIAGDKSVSL